MADESSSSSSSIATAAAAITAEAEATGGDLPISVSASSSTTKPTTTTTANNNAASTATATAASAATTISSSTNNNSNNSTNIEFEPPAACIRRLLKQCLPKSTNVSKDSLAAISRASGIFVLYLTACANDVAREGRRTTIVAKDVLGALKELDFEEFIPCMDVFLEGYRREEKNKKEEKEAMKVKRFQQQQQQQQLGRDGTTGKFIAKEDDGYVDEGDEKIQEEDGMDGTMKRVRDEEEDYDDTGNEGEEPLAKKLKEGGG